MSSFDERAPNLKVVFLGEATVGKTSIVTVAQKKEFIPEQTATVGACFELKEMCVDGKNVNIHMWDTAGQERFRALAPMCYRDAQIAVLVYAINNEDSFSKIEHWHANLCKDCLEMPKVVIVANKIDLRDSLESYVKTEQGTALADKLEARFFEVSAKCDFEGVEKMFEEIARMGLTKSEQIQKPVVLPVKEQRAKKGCCKG